MSPYEIDIKSTTRSITKTKQKQQKTTKYCNADHVLYVHYKTLKDKNETEWGCSSGGVYVPCIYTHAKLELP